VTKIKLLAAAALAIAFAVPASAQQTMTAKPAQTSFDEAESRAIEEIVHDYLVTNPEVLLEVMDALEIKRSAQQLASQKKAITDTGPTLFETPEGTALGNPDGDVTVVEFFDYNCSFCKRAMADMDALVENDPNVRFILKEIPVLGPQSLEAATVSLAFRELAPEKYAAFHRDLLAGRGVADEAKALTVAEGFGISEEQLRPVMGSPAVKAALQEADQLAQGLAINGTPSYVIADKVLPGAVGVADLTATIANVRKCGSATC